MKCFFQILEKFGRIFNLEDTFLLVDGNLASSPGFKSLKSILTTRKQHIIEVGPGLKFLKSLLNTRNHFIEVTLIT